MGQLGVTAGVAYLKLGSWGGKWIFVFEWGELCFEDPLGFLDCFSTC